MIYIILIIIGIIGISITLWINHSRLQLDQTPDGDPWYIMHPMNLESGFIQYMRSTIRFWIKKLLIIMIGIYRNLSEKITLKKIVRQKIRGFLYEHTQEGIRKPSDFWNKVRKTQK